MKEVTRTPVLEAKASKGTAKYWFGRVLTDGTDCYLQSEAWQATANGESKHLISTPAKVTPKSKTTPEQQARFELQSKLKRQLDKGYHELGKVVERTFTLPMLAHPIQKKLHTVTFPSYIQPKYNGIRCLYNSRIGFWSRQGNELIQEVTQHLQFDTKGLTMDGELLLPHITAVLPSTNPDRDERASPPSLAQYTFQQTISAIKKYDPLVSPKLYYVMYDIVDTALTFENRWQLLKARVLEAQMAERKTVFQLAPTMEVTGPEQVTAWHQEFVRQGFEGSILRRPAGMYTPGHRNDALLKLKDFIDGEYKIVGFEEGKGKDKGAIIFVCVTPEGREFRARPEGPYTERQRMFDEWTRSGLRMLKQNPMLTVRYQTLTDDKVPLFPVGVAVRDYE